MILLTWQLHLMPSLTICLQGDTQDNFHLTCQAKVIQLQDKKSVGNLQTKKKFSFPTFRITF